MDSSELIRHKNYILYNPVRIDYTVTGEEMDQLCDGGKSMWKEFCFIAFSLGIPCLINAIADTNTQNFDLTLAIFLNYLVGVLGIVLGIVFGILWKNTEKRTSDLVMAIKSKPRYEIVPSVENIGALQAIQSLPPAE